MDDFAIKVEDVSKVFKLPHEKNNSVKSLVLGFYKRDRGYEMQKALRNVSLEIKKGEFFGIVGRNGSGKSTLLKLLAGIYTPTTGQVHVRGSLTPFIELGVGFSPELTGRENVYLNGALLGFSRKEMQAMYEDIVEFAELKKFMDQKLKNYSSGMQVRLAFSIAIRAQSDILLIDEVLAVGDAAFQRKCYDYFEQLKDQKRTVILVSHDMDAVKEFCSRVCLITNGELTYAGAPEQATDLYDKQNATDKNALDKTPMIHAGAKIKNLTIVDKKESYDEKDTLTFRIELNVEKTMSPHLGIQIVRDDGQLIAGVSSQFQISPTEAAPNTKAVYEFSFKCDQFSNGKYIVEGVVYDHGHADPVFYKSSMANFKINGKEQGWGILNLEGKWKLG